MSERWSRFYAAAGSDPRETLLDALARFEAEGRTTGTAVDLGCGTGRDTVELLRRGWHVVAIDSQPEAIERLRAHPEAVAAADRLHTVAAGFEDAEWPAGDLVNASFALPFCPPEVFARTWPSIVSSLRPGGRFCGQLFGVHDQWSPSLDMNFHTREDVESLLDGLETERLEELEQDGRTAVGDTKYWHLFHVVARRP